MTWPRGKPFYEDMASLTVFEQTYTPFNCRCHQRLELHASLSSAGRALLSSAYVLRLLASARLGWLGGCMHMRMRASVIVCARVHLSWRVCLSLSARSVSIRCPGLVPAEHVTGS